MYKQGTVVLVPFPFTDLSGTKVRPAVVLSHKLSGDDLIVLFLSSKKGRGVYDVPLIPNTQNGLKMPSVAKCTKIATLDCKVVLGEIGSLTKSELQKILIVLSRVFSL